MKQDFKNLRHTFWAHTNRSTMSKSKSYFKIFLLQEAGAFGNNTEKELQKPHPKLKKYIFTENTCSACNPVQEVV